MADKTSGNCQTRVDVIAKVECSVRRFSQSSSGYFEIPHASELSYLYYSEGNEVNSYRQVVHTRLRHQTIHIVAGAE